MLWKDRNLIVFLLALFLCLLITVNFPKFSDVSCSSPIVRTEEDFVGWVREQQERKSRVAKVCAEDPRWKDSWLRSPNYWQYSFLHNQEHSLLGCLQPKVRQYVLKYVMIMEIKHISSGSWKVFSFFLLQVGSTTWHQHFVSLANPGMHAELEKHERDEQESTLIKITSKHGTYVSIPAG